MHLLAPPWEAHPQNQIMHAQHIVLVTHKKNANNFVTPNRNNIPETVEVQHSSIKTSEQLFSDMDTIASNIQHTDYSSNFQPRPRIFDQP